MPLDDPKIREALDEDTLPRMSFGDHLDELRSRLWKSLLAVVVAVVALLPFKGPVQEIIIHPYRQLYRNEFPRWIEQLEEKVAAAKAAGLAVEPDTLRYLKYCTENRDAILSGTKDYTWNLTHDSGFPLPYGLFATNGLDDMMSFMWASLVFALVVASPVVIWHVWAFIGAGLYKHERAVFYRYFPFMVGLLVTGVLFGYWVALPYSLGFLVRMMDPQQVTAIFSVGQFLNLEFALTGAMGLVFQLPMVMLALQKTGLVTHRGFVKNWRMTILVIFVVAAVVTPPDPVSMLLMASPMLLLYGLGLCLTFLGRKRDAVVVAA
ncbi:MAG: twin-arginine translocase subunit TatC [Planctomycetes bacterium]|nr:twin-arginine translocase subunit TatC [Planctomycetota bacterium]